MNVPLSVHLKDQYHIKTLEKYNNGQRLPQYGEEINVPSPIFFELTKRDIKDTRTVCKCCLHGRTFIDQTNERLDRYRGVERKDDKDER